MREFFDWCLAHWSFVAFVLAIFIQITPAIKWNPITALGNLLLGSIRKELASIREQMDEDKKDTIRWEVLNFATSCRNGVLHTKDDFEHVINQNDKYHKLLQKTGDTNGVFEEEYNYILRIYHDRQEKNDFL